jgi:hypothetical protein
MLVIKKAGLVKNFSNFSAAFRLIKTGPKKTLFCCAQKTNIFSTPII